MLTSVSTGGGGTDARTRNFLPGGSLLLLSYVFWLWALGFGILDLRNLRELRAGVASIGTGGFFGGHMK